MSFTDKFNKWSDTGKNLLLILLIAGAITFGILTIIGDFTEPTPPKIPNDAVWVFTIENTGQQILAKDYTLTDGAYVLDDYWELQDSKWRYREARLPLDETYFGPLQVERIAR